MKYLAIILFSLILVTGCTSVNYSAGLTEEWVRTAPTYAFDGDNLELVTHTVEGATQTFEYRFTSTQAGYGDRSDDMVAQVETEHTIEIVIENGEIVSAIINGEWDEIEQEKIPDTEVLRFQPMQCEETPWNTWNQNGFETESEIIIAYYADSYDIDIHSVERIEPERMVCMACSTCPTVHYFEAEVSADVVEQLREHGWQ